MALINIKAIYYLDSFAIQLVGILTIVFSIIFILFPELDLIVARFFYDEADNFLLRNTTFHSFVDNWIRPSIKYAFLLILCFFFFFLIKKTTLIRQNLRAIIFVSSSFIIGPILLVNGLLKEHIGRARPKNIIDFGGDKLFSPAYFSADQCITNCSFVSGDAAAAFTTLTFALLFSGKIRIPMIFLSISLGIVVSVYRLGTGAHFLSDTLLAGMFCIFIVLVLERMLYGTNN